MSENIKRRGRPKKIVEINEEVVEETVEPIEFEPLEQIEEVEQISTCSYSKSYEPVSTEIFHLSLLACTPPLSYS